MLRLIYLVIVLVGQISSQHHANDVKDDPDPGQALFLTPYIEENRIEEALERAHVHGISDDVVSYSGFITVNKNYNSNLFFWFFPAMEVEIEKAPVIAYLNSGPGLSSVNTLFTENGPFMIDEHQQMSRREDTWTKYHSVIYIDSPVGVGFSFTDSNQGFPRNESQVSKDLHIFLVQFFTMFSNLQSNDFYIAGESYGGKYAPSLAWKIHFENQKSSTRINLKGVTIGNGFTHPQYHIDRTELLFQLGLVDIRSKYYLAQNVKQVQDLILEEKWDEAMKSFFEYLGNMGNATDYHFWYNVLYPEAPDVYFYYIDYVSSNSVKKKVHVGHVSFNHFSSDVYESLWQDFMKSAKPEVEFLLQNGYFVLFYNGLLDLCVPYASTARLMNELEWEGSKDFQEAKRLFWHVDGELAGYIQEGHNLVFIGVRNAGHMVPFDQPKVAERLIREFVSGRITSQ